MCVGACSSSALWPANVFAVLVITGPPCGDRRENICAKIFTGAAEAAAPSWHFEENDQTSLGVSLQMMGYPQKDPKELIWRGIDVHRN